MQKLILIDGHAILHRAYHALPPLTTSKGQQINAVYGFISMLLRVVGNFNPTHLIVTFDTPKPTFRNKLFKDYQSQRPEMDDEMKPQIGLVHDLISKMGISYFEKDGFEADDVIGTICYKTLNIKNKPKNDDWETIIVTGDKDIMQLVDERIKVYMPVKGLSESKLYSQKDVEEKLGIKPDKIIEYKSLVGDPSDNYPGVSGIGPKTAVNLINQFGNLDNIYKNLDRIKSEKVRNMLQENRDLAYVSRELATIKTDVPLEIDWDKCRFVNLDRPGVVALFEEYEFRSLIPRLSLVNSQQSTVNKIKMKTKENNKNINAEQTSLF